ncbi:peptidoglycan bridge formation glycyltransferase FemA/FemB family protein [Candidatus Saccharibacteria bacterium]|nr:peptidoglycan bridge formation glycyltransferase FemA/FemB family protein [Candidatus Saccharibacteria bacterium]
MEIPLQQTKNWQKLQTKLGEKTFYEKTNDYTYLCIEKQTKFGNYLYLPYGPYAPTKNSARKVYKALESLADSKNITFIRIEPQSPETAEFWLNLPNCQKSRNLSPEETWILDLRLRMDEIYKNMKQNTRNLCKNYAKKGLSVKISDDKSRDIKILAKFHKEIAKQHKIGAFSENYLRAEAEQDFATLYVAYFEKKPIAASLFFDHGDTRYYMQSASDKNYHKLPATYAILNEAIKDAKAKNLKNFDFWGIAPENAPKSHPWSGFTSFKKSFGGREVKYLGTYDLVFRPVEYKIYQLARSGNRFLRRLRK